MVHVSLVYMIIGIIEDLKIFLEIKRGRLCFGGLEPCGYV